MSWLCRLRRIRPCSNQGSCTGSMEQERLARKTVSQARFYKNFGLSRHSKKFSLTNLTQDAKMTGMMKSRLDNAVAVAVLVSGISLALIYVPWSGAVPEEMITEVFSICDIDRDRDCDSDDFNLFDNALGECEDGDSYNEVADADHDGCVTVMDQEVLFPGK